jgi:uncharacterized membrane protein
MDSISIVQSLAALTGTAFFLWLGYGALLIVADSEKRWKERYGNRWIISKSERARLDKAYADNQQNKNAS